MPRMDKTGPMGQGQVTGRGMGQCGSGQGVESKSGFGRGRGQGFRRGFCWRRNFTVNLTPEEEKKILEAEKQEIEKKLKEVKE